MGREDARARPGVVGLALVAIGTAAVAQTTFHLELALGEHRLGTVLDLDRSNGIPDVVSTLALAAGAAGAGLLARWTNGARRKSATALVAVLTLLTLADVLHDGAHPAGRLGPAVIGLALAATGLLLMVALDAPWSTRGVFAVSLVALAGAFVLPGLDRYDRWFDRERGDPVREYQIVAKEGLELIGWSLVALALWNEALRRRTAETSLGARASASRARAASRRRAA